MCSHRHLCVVLFNGYPGVGKFTIAKALETKLDVVNLPYRRIYNHLLTGPAVAIHLDRNKAHYTLRKKLRLDVSGALKTLEGKFVIIFTACLATSTKPTPYNFIDQFREYVDLAEGRGVLLVMVNIVCNPAIHRQRLVSEEGRNGEKKKLVDTDTLDKITEDTSLLTREQAMEHGNGWLSYYEINTSEFTVEDSIEKRWELLHEVIR